MFDLGETFMNLFRDEEMEIQKQILKSKFINERLFSNYPRGGVVVIIKCQCMGCKGQFTRGPKSQVPLMLANPNMEAKSQLLSLKKSLKYG
jgi:hypothetical protein